MKRSVLITMKKLTFASKTKREYVDMISDVKYIHN